MIVAISNPREPAPCYSSIITDPVPAPDAVTGVVTITHSAVAAAVGATLVNLGPAKLVQKTVYDVSSGNLRSTSLLDANGAPSGVQASNPIASNIVNMKIQYGIDDVGNGLIHHWVPGISGTAYGDWDPATLLAAPITTLNRIKAARIAILVRSEQPDKGLPARDSIAPSSTIARCRGRQLWGHLRQPAVAAGTQPTAGATVYETVIPLRNEVWNRKYENRTHIGIGRQPASCCSLR